MSQLPACPSAIRIHTRRSGAGSRRRRSHASSSRRSPGVPCRERSRTPIRCAMSWSSRRSEINRVHGTSSWNCSAPTSWPRRPRPVPQPRVRPAAQPAVPALPDGQGPVSVASRQDDGGPMQVGTEGRADLGGGAAARSSGALWPAGRPARIRVPATSPASAGTRHRHPPARAARAVEAAAGRTSPSVRPRRVHNRVPGRASGSARSRPRPCRRGM